MRDKLSANTDHYETDQAQAVYVLGRVGGVTQNHVNSYRSGNIGYSLTAEMVFQALKDVYEESDKVEKARIAYISLKQGPGGKFSDFFSTFIRTVRTNQLPDNQVMFDLRTK